MGLMGPRPFPDYHLTKFSPEFLSYGAECDQALLVSGRWLSEGIGGWEQETYDSYYIRNWSVWLDVYILSRTLAAVTSGRGGPAQIGQRRSLLSLLIDDTPVKSQHRTPRYARLRRFRIT